MQWPPNALTIARTGAIVPIAALLFCSAPEARWIARVLANMPRDSSRACV